MYIFMCAWMQVKKEFSPLQTRSDSDPFQLTSLFRAVICECGLATVNETCRRLTLPLIWTKNHSDSDTAACYIVLSPPNLRACSCIFPQTARRYLTSLIYPLTARVVGAPQMISKPVSSIFPCSPLPSGTLRTPGLFIPWCCLSTFSTVCLVLFPLSLCLARRFWPDLMNGRHDHTTAVCVSLQWSGGLRVVRLPSGSWHGLPRW